MPGPVPKRSDQRRRRNKSDGPDPVTALSGMTDLLASEDAREVARVTLMTPTVRASGSSDG